MAQVAAECKTGRKARAGNGEGPEQWFADGKRAVRRSGAGSTSAFKVAGRKALQFKVSKARHAYSGPDWTRKRGGGGCFMRLAGRPSHEGGV